MTNFCEETDCGEREQADDISVLAIRWLGPGISKNN